MTNSRYCREVPQTLRRDLDLSTLLVQFLCGGMLLYFFLERILCQF